MPIIRFVDTTNEVHFGIPGPDNTAELLLGDPLASIVPTGKTVPIGRLLAPIEPKNIFAIGLNYKRHAKETQAAIPSQPVVFMKATTSVIGPKTPIRIPACSVRGPEVDYECELAVIIGKPTQNATEKNALDHVFGYTCANDVSARRWQKHGGAGQWVRGKSFNTFCPLGPQIALRDEIGDPQSLALSTVLNGVTRQSSNTSDMIFDVKTLITFLSQDTLLLPGTVILTGTPEGVGFVRKPPVFLSPGDEVQVHVEGIGTLVNPVLGPERDGRG